MDMLTSLGITKDLIADLIINIGSMVVLFLVVKKLAYKPVKKFMDERTARVMAQKEEAQRLSEEARIKSEECDVVLKECEEAKANAVKQGEKEALRESEEILTQAKQKASDIIDKANKKAQEKYDRAIEEANEYIVNLTLDASSMLLQRQMTDEDNKKIVEQFLGSVKGDENA